MGEKLGTLIPDKRNIGVADLSFGQLSDLIHGIRENRLRHASGPVHKNQYIRYIDRVKKDVLPREGQHKKEKKQVRCSIFK